MAQKKTGHELDIKLSKEDMYTLVTEDYVAQLEVERDNTKAQRDEINSQLGILSDKLDDALIGLTMETLKPFLDSLGVSCKKNDFSVSESDAYGQKGDAFRVVYETHADEESDRTYCSFGKSFKQAVLNQIPEYTAWKARDKEHDELDNRVYKLNNMIKEARESPNKVRAQLIRSVLSSSEEGKAILAHLPKVHLQKLLSK